MAAYSRVILRFSCDEYDVSSFDCLLHSWVHIRSAFVAPRKQKEASDHQICLNRGWLGPALALPPPLLGWLRTQQTSWCISSVEKARHGLVTFTDRGVSARLNQASLSLNNYHTNRAYGVLRHFCPPSISTYRVFFERQVNLYTRYEFVLFSAARVNPSPHATRTANAFSLT